MLVGARTPDELERSLADQGLVLSDEVIAKLEEATEAVKVCLGDNIDMWQTPSRLR
jgi:hypothetical protein